MSFCQCPMMNCFRALSLNGRLDNQSGGQVHFHNHYLDVFFARWLPTPERTTSDMSARGLVNSIKPDRGQKYQFHLRPLAFGEIIIFTPTSGSLSKKSSIFCTLLRPKVARPKIPYFCVGPDGNIRAENVSGRMGTSAQKMADAPTPVPTATRSSPRRSHEPTVPTVTTVPLIHVLGKPERPPKDTMNHR